MYQKTKIIVVKQKIKDPKPLVTLEEFTYLGSIVSIENGVKKVYDQSHTAFYRHQRIWKSQNFSILTLN